jgi:actin-like ATPase involved in cell morphogenesis
MSFILGLDVGTASGAGATKRDGRVQPSALGDRTATLPSVVVLHDDGSMLVGEEAERVAGLELTRVARDVRLDPAQQATPIAVGGRVHTPHELLRSLYSTMVERVCLAHHATPSHIVLTHPAMPEGLRCESVDRIADELFPGALVVPEPIAATVKLACDGALPPDCVVAVYDFGGGTFDATLVRRDGDRFSVIGDPTGLPKFGGIDVDDLVLNYVDQTLEGAVATLDLQHPDAMDALTHLRAECRAAKERLSYDTEVTIDASLPGAPALVRLTRDEFDAFLLPNLEQTVDVVEQLIAANELQPHEIDALALVGGSSRIPLVVELVTARTNIPVLVDPYPELTVALGAAQMIDEEAPASSVFPFADLALPSLTAMSGAVGLASPPSGYDDTFGGAMGQAVGSYSPPMGSHVGSAVGTYDDDTQFDQLTRPFRDAEETEFGESLSPEVERGTGVGKIVGQGLNPKTGVLALAGVIAVLVVAVLLMGGSDSPTKTKNPQTAANQDAITTTTGAPNAAATPSSDSTPTTSPRESTTSTTNPRTTTTMARPTTTDAPGATQPPGPTTPTTDPPTTTSTSTTTTSTSTTTTSTTTSTTAPPPPSP